MGSSESRMSKPDELALFKKIPETQIVAEIDIPERAENRVPTDRKFLVVLGVALLLLLPFLAYTLANSDLDRYSFYDECGNVCGKKNPKYDQWDCTGKDYTDRRFLEFSEVRRSADIFLADRQCVSKCSQGRQEVFSYCIKSDNTDNDVDVDDTFERWSTEIPEYLQAVAWRLTLACFASLAIAMSMLYLFRVATAAMVWSILIGVVTFLTIFVIFLWYGYSQSSIKERGSVIAPAFFTIVLLVLVLVLIFLYKKIALVIALFKEAMKATFAMPRLLFVPILTFFVELAILVVFVVILVYFNTSGVLKEITPGFLKYEPNLVMRFSAFFTFWMTFWVSQFITGVQYMVIAGAVAKWYFAKDKNNLESPICTSASIAFKFHLGSVAFGSMIITIMAIIREFLSSILKNKCIKACVESCLAIVEDFLKYLSKNAYILTAMHGKPFYKSGKRAAQIILQNVVNIAVLNYIGDFIIVMAHVLVVLLSMLFTYLILQGAESPYEWTVYVIVAIVAFIVAAISFSIFETVIDTIFLCFCEDKLLNDGMARPYAMSRDLMEFMEDSKKIFGEKKKCF